jgi:hypothetical protein
LFHTAVVTLHFEREVEAAEPFRYHVKLTRVAPNAPQSKQENPSVLPSLAA